MCGSDFATVLLPVSTTWIVRKPGLSQEDVSSDPNDWPWLFSQRARKKWRRCSQLTYTFPFENVKREEGDNGADTPLLPAGRSPRCRCNSSIDSSYANFDKCGFSCTSMFSPWKIHVSHVTFSMGSTVVKWLALSPDNNMVLGSNLTMFYLWVCCICFRPQSKDWCQWLFVSIRQPCDMVVPSASRPTSGWDRLPHWRSSVDERWTVDEENKDGWTLRSGWFPFSFVFMFWSNCQTANSFLKL